ncbi:hypothetical protein OK016_00500 [Vibrio chagasii]|nr:hypothetical protein [Vibrio chagasii]
MSDDARYSPRNLCSMEHINYMMGEGDYIIDRIYCRLRCDLFIIALCLSVNRSVLNRILSESCVADVLNGVKPNTME